MTVDRARTGLALALVLFVSMVAVGCGGSGSESGDRTDTTGSQAAAGRDDGDGASGSAGVAGSEVEGGADESEGDAPASTPRSKVTASTTVERGAKRVRVDLRGLHRDGKLVRLDYSVVNLGSEQIFASDVVSLISPSIELVDTAGLKRYLIVKDEEQQGLLQRPDVYLDAGAQFHGSGYFAAPPESVDAIDVVFGEHGRFRTPIA